VVSSSAAFGDVLAALRAPRQPQSVWQSARLARQHGGRQQRLPDAYGPFKFYSRLNVDEDGSGFLGSRPVFHTRVGVRPPGGAGAEGGTGASWVDASEGRAANAGAGAAKLQAAPGNIAGVDAARFGLASWEQPLRDVGRGGSGGAADGGPAAAITRDDAEVANSLADMHDSAGAEGDGDESAAAAVRAARRAERLTRRDAAAAPARWLRGVGARLTALERQGSPAQPQVTRTRTPRPAAASPGGALADIDWSLARTLAAAALPAMSASAPATQAEPRGMTVQVDGTTGRVLPPPSTAEKVSAAVARAQAVRAARHVNAVVRGGGARAQTNARGSSGRGFGAHRAAAPELGTLQ
jgi:hypothetical protein